MKEWAFDKNAKAMVLFEKGQLVYFPGKGIDPERDIPIKS